RRHTISKRDWSSDVCSSDLTPPFHGGITGSIPVRVTILLKCSRRISSAGRAPALQAGGRRFEPVNLHYYTAGWSSLVARWAHNPKVGSSNLDPATKFKYYIICNERSKSSIVTYVVR